MFTINDKIAMWRGTKRFNGLATVESPSNPNLTGTGFVDPNPVELMPAKRERRKRQPETVTPIN